MVSQITEERRPYGPPSNVIDVLHRLRERNLPTRIDAAYLLAAGVTENLVRHAQFGLEFLGLIDAVGEPTEVLRAIARATDEEYHAQMAEAVRRAYRDVLEVVDPSTDDPSRILNAFRRFSPASQRSRMVSFFLALCREAGIPVIEPQRQPPGPTASRARGARRREPAPRRNSGQPGAAPVAAASQRPAEIPTGLRFLIEMLPPEGQPLSRERRDQWLTMAREALKFAYPEIDSPTGETGSGKQS